MSLKLHLQSRVTVAVDDLAKAYLTSKRLGEHKRLVAQQRLVFPAEFIGEDRTKRNESRLPAPALRYAPGHPAAA